PDPRPQIFRNVTLGSGVDFEHWDGRSGRRFYMETASGGGGFLDADGDGALDLYLLNGASTPGSPARQAPRNALFVQRNGAFVDVSAASGVDDAGYGMGLCIADVTGDGLPDLYVTNFGADRFYLSRGVVDGVPRFEEASTPAGLGDGGWGTGCAFGDVDGDGDLDLYVVRYLDYSVDRNRLCGDPARGIAGYCRPSVFRGQADLLYLRRGDRDGAPLFEEVGLERGLVVGDSERGFAVVLSDLDVDGDLDAVVANDGTANRFYRNDGGGFFTDVALLSGLAVDRTGDPGASMGLELADADGDGRMDVFVTHYAHEANTLYLATEDASAESAADPRPYFEDRTAEAGLAAPSFLSVGWGARFFDLENDGDLDLAVANGHVMDNIDLFEPRSSYPQADHLYRNDGAGRFVEISAATSGYDAPTPAVSRALAAGDWNDDGGVDLLITATNGRPRLLENVAPDRGRWIGLVLRGPRSNTLAIGARVVVRTGDGRVVGVGEVRSGGSFLAQNDLRLHFGLGPDPAPLQVEVRWPDGRAEVVSISDFDRYETVEYGASGAAGGEL
ncbi:MAG: CRTAC1 family protein, partial [Acidobacteriota bacterium]